jgi:hypothetical protein
VRCRITGLTERRNLTSRLSAKRCCFGPECNTYLLSGGLWQSDLDDPLKFLQLAATAQPKIRFNLGMGAFRCVILPLVDCDMLNEMDMVV